MSRLMTLSKQKPQFREGAYDLVLLDVSMKPIDGFELYRQLLQVDNKVRVCFITALKSIMMNLGRSFQNCVSIALFASLSVWIG